MDFTQGFIALIWGGLAGYLLLRAVDSLVGLLFCLHGLFEQRWKRLADKNATNLVRPRRILKLGLRLGCSAALCVFLLNGGDAFLRRAYHFQYVDSHGIVFVVAGGVILLSRLLISWRRIKLVWRLSHEFDFAERRERTRLLRR